MARKVTQGTHDVASSLGPAVVVAAATASKPAIVLVRPAGCHCA